MIRFIAAIDSKKGLANDHGIPWQGKIPSDVDQFREKTRGTSLMMGYGWYQEQEKPLPERRNIVAIDHVIPMRPGFELTTDARQFLADFSEDIWVGGGAILFTTTLDLADELYLTRLDGDFACTKFFPDFEDQFELVHSSEAVTENDITYHFEVWKRKQQK